MRLIINPTFLPLSSVLKPSPFPLNFSINGTHSSVLSRSIRNIRPAVFTCPPQWHLLRTAEDGTRKCVRYFDNPVNFSEAQYVCNEIYEGDLVSVNSPEEQKLLVQYLHGLLGFKRQPVCWLGAILTQSRSPASVSTTGTNGNTLASQLKWLDGTQAMFQNLPFDPLTVIANAGNL